MGVMVVMVRRAAATAMRAAVLTDLTANVTTAGDE
jgi:hypothetical protein